MCTATRLSSVRLLALVVLATILACSPDSGCLTCPPPPPPPPPPPQFPSVGGVWSVEYTFVESGSGISVLVEDHLVVSLTQRDSVLAGRVGGTIQSCVSSYAGSFCDVDILYKTAVSGRVRSDGTVLLAWLEDSTQFTIQGRVDALGMSGGSDGTSWRASREQPVPVSQARTASGDTVVVRGVLTVSKGLFAPGDVVYVQDGSAGIEVIGLPDGPWMLKGDSVLIRGVSARDAYGERALIPISEGYFYRPPESVREGIAATPAPQVVTVSDIASRRLEGSLVTVAGVRLLSKPSSATGGYTLKFADASGASFDVGVHPQVATSLTLASWTVGATYDVTGILGSSNGTPNLQIRGTSDRVLR